MYGDCLARNFLTGCNLYVCTFVYLFPLVVGDDHWHVLRGRPSLHNGRLLLEQKQNVSAQISLKIIVNISWKIGNGLGSHFQH